MDLDSLRAEIDACDGEIVDALTRRARAARAIGELKAFRQKDDLSAIYFIIPILNLLEMWKLPAKVLEAKYMAGVPNAQVVHPILYLLLGVYFLTVDLNETFEAAAARQQLGAPPAPQQLQPPSDPMGMPPQQPPPQQPPPQQFGGRFVPGADDRVDLPLRGNVAHASLLADAPHE